jgi:hypothetical protein
VEANQEEFIGCPRIETVDYGEIKPSELPVVRLENQNPLECTYCVGKQTLKENYVGQKA